MTFEYKGYGRIFVEKEEDISIVKEKIKETDDFEYEYLPSDLITVWNGRADDVTYTYKFNEMDIDKLCEELQYIGVKCAWVRGFSNFMFEQRRKLTENQAKLMYNAGFISKNEILKEFGLDFLIDGEK